MVCRSPDCRTEAPGGDRFCDSHRAIFDRIRNEIEEGRAERRRSSGVRRRRVAFSRCVVIDCDTPAKPGHPKCLHHLRFYGEA